MNILVTGGAGYIGSHMCVSLVKAGHRPVIIDDLSNSTVGVLDAIEKVAGSRPDFIRGDISDASLLRSVLVDHGIEAVIHFAGSKAVGESALKPLSYYANNVAGTIALVATMAAVGVKTLIFSSSATVYGAPKVLPVTEDSPRSATNPYGRTKLFIEYILEDVFKADPAWSISILRYFNPVGAHPSGKMGEDPRGVPNNLMPYIAQVAVGRRKTLPIFGTDYPTRDGTGVRDYVHVMDLVEGHLAVLDAHAGRPGQHVYNLGTGKGFSVLELLDAFRRASGKPLPSVIEPRRPGDVAELWASTEKIERELNWHAARSLEQMCADTWRWQSMNPDGYAR